MLILARRKNQRIVIGRDIEIIVFGITEDQVRLGITAPKEVPVHRLEIAQKIEREEGGE